MRPKLVSILTGTILILFATGISGCGGGGDGLERVAVNGAVTLNGEPVPNGVIRFAPSAGTTGPMASAMITDGQYQIPREQGPVAGSYEVRIHAYADPNVKSTAETEPAGETKLGPKISNTDADANAGNAQPAASAPIETRQTFEATIPESSSYERDFAL